MRSPRYLALLDMLVDAARAPQLSPDAQGAAVKALPELVVRPGRKLVYGGGPPPGAAGLQQQGPDEEWHAVRIRGKRARYATDAAATVIGGAAGARAARPGRGRSILVQAH